MSNVRFTNMLFKDNAEIRQLKTINSDTDFNENVLYEFDNKLLFSGILKNINPSLTKYDFTLDDDTITPAIKGGKIYTNTDIILEYSNSDISSELSDVMEKSINAIFNNNESEAFMWLRLAQFKLSMQDMSYPDFKAKARTKKLRRLI